MIEIERASAQVANEPRGQTHDLPTLVLRAPRGWSSLQLQEIWEYRELLVYLLWREVQSAYRQTALGYSWLFMRPLVNMLVLSFVFGRVVNVPSDNLPYPLFAVAALLPWSFFANGVTRASRSLVDNMHLISKVYFPRLIVPIAGAASGLIDFAASLVVLLGVLFVYRMPLRLEMLWVPLLLVLTLIFALGVGLWLATLSARYRDVSFAVQFLLQALMYMSPVIYSTSLVPAQLLPLYKLNPMTLIIQGYRWAILGTEPPTATMVIVCMAFLVALLASGAYVFKRTERSVVDVI